MDIDKSTQEKLNNLKKVLPKSKEEKLKSPFELFGVECGKGWHKFILPVFEFIEKYNNEHEGESRIIVDQVKEKWGYLEIYVSFENVPDDVVKETYRLIGVARKEASETCEFCGSKENVGYVLNNWNLTICEDCLHKRLKDREEWFGTEQSSIWKRLSDGKKFDVTKDTIEERNGN